MQIPPLKHGESRHSSILSLNLLLPKRYFLCYWKGLKWMSGSYMDRQGVLYIYLLSYFSSLPIDNTTMTPTNTKITTAVLMMPMRFNFFLGPEFPAEGSPWFLISKLCGCLWSPCAATLPKFPGFSLLVFLKPKMHKCPTLFRKHSGHLPLKSVIVIFVFFNFFLFLLGSGGRWESHIFVTFNTDAVINLQ